MYKACAPRYFRCLITCQCNYLRWAELLLCVICLICAGFVFTTEMHIASKILPAVVPAIFIVIILFDMISGFVLCPFGYIVWLVVSLVAFLLFCLSSGILLFQKRETEKGIFYAASAVYLFTVLVYLFDYIWTAIEFCIWKKCCPCPDPCCPPDCPEPICYAPCPCPPCPPGCGPPSPSFQRVPCPPGNPCPPSRPPICPVPLCPPPCIQCPPPCPQPRFQCPPPCPLPCSPQYSQCASPCSTPCKPCPPQCASPCSTPCKPCPPQCPPPCSTPCTPCPLPCPPPCRPPCPTPCTPCTPICVPQCTSLLYGAANSSNTCPVEGCTTPCRRPGCPAQTTARCSCRTTPLGIQYQAYHATVKVLYGPEVEDDESANYLEKKRFSQSSSRSSSEHKARLRKGTGDREKPTLAKLASEHNINKEEKYELPQFKKKLCDESPPFYMCSIDSKFDTNYLKLNSISDPNSKEFRYRKNPSGSQAVKRKKEFLGPNFESSFSSKKLEEQPISPGVRKSKMSVDSQTSNTQLVEKRIWACSTCRKLFEPRVEFEHDSIEIKPSTSSSKENSVRKKLRKDFRNNKVYPLTSTNLDNKKTLDVENKIDLIANTNPENKPSLTNNGDTPYRNLNLQNKESLDFRNSSASGNVEKNKIKENSRIPRSLLLWSRENAVKNKNSETKVKQNTLDGLTYKLGNGKTPPTEAEQKIKSNRTSELDLKENSESETSTGASTGKTYITSKVSLSKVYNNSSSSKTTTEQYFGSFSEEPSICCDCASKDQIQLQHWMGPIFVYCTCGKC